MNELVQLLTSGNYHNIIVLTGAGISTAAGIPDFRSPSIGLYASLKTMSHLEFKSPTFVFDISEFKKDPRPFWWVFSDLWPKDEWPLPTNFHYLISLLNEKNMLLRCYTQNVDDLETLAGIPADKLVFAHGILTPCHCIDCGEEVSLKHCLDSLGDLTVKKSKYEDVQVPICPHCGQNHVKPDVVFFGQNLPARFGQMLDQDFDQCDLLIIAGTSLEVYPFAGLPDHVHEGVKRFLINRDKVRAKGGAFKKAMDWVKDAATLFLFERSGMFEFGNDRDFFLGGDCQENARQIIEAMNWNDDLEVLRQRSREMGHPLYSLTRSAAPTEEVPPPPAEDL